MINSVQALENFKMNKYDSLLKDIYVDEKLIDKQRQRYIDAIKEYQNLFGQGEVSIFSAPGRTEVCGNHTDHQYGKVLAASINLDIVAITATNDSNIVKVVSHGYDMISIDVDDLDVKENEIGKTAGLIRGVLKGLKDRGYDIGGFNAYTTSEVLIGSGLSSSAAFENVIGVIVSGLFNENKIDAITLAQVSKFAENVYFNKPCGLMDQMASAVGGLISVDFENPQLPVVKKLEVDFEKYGYSICIVDTKGSHVDLTDDYAMIPIEMKKVANYMGKQTLRDCDEEQFYSLVSEIRKTAGDRATLRAIHFFSEQRRVEMAIDSLNKDDIDTFLSNIKKSGNSSFKYLQNVYTNIDVQNQSVSVALAISELLLLEQYGVSRVHGGGFAGTIQAFVKNEFVDNYRESIEKVFGKGTCHVLKIRKHGSIKVI